MIVVRNKLCSSDLRTRIQITFLIFIILFFGVTVFAYYLLPEGLLKNKNPLQNWEASGNAIISAIQIFLYNSMSIMVIFLGSLFGRKKESETQYLSLGYQAFFTLITINAIVLGTWSFSVESESLPLITRLLRTFDLLHRAGLWEMSGQLLFTCSLAQSAIVLTNGKNTTTGKIKDIHLIRSERIAIVVGILFLLVGALVESTAINNIA
mgnify:FL=1